MKLVPCAAAAAIAALLLGACDQRPAQTAAAPPATPEPIQLSAASAPTNSATDPYDPSLPSAEHVFSTPKTATDAAHTATTAGERDTQMPMKGQVNDYNTPDRAKEADQPRTASKEPGGQEAHPGNNPGNQPRSSDNGQPNT